MATARWRALARQEPALVLLDVMLPGRDGIAVLRELIAASSRASR